MSAHTKIPPTSDLSAITVTVIVTAKGRRDRRYQFSVGEDDEILHTLKEYRDATGRVPLNDLFSDLKQKYTKAGALLRAARSREDLTRKQLAAYLEIPTNHVAEMENGKRAIDAKMAKKLSTCLMVNHKIFLSQ